MTQLQGKKILLAISGSIAAYKMPELVRRFLKAGAEVKVVMTAAAADFVSPLALSTVSKNPVLNAVHEAASWNNHVTLGRWADVMLIAPCSANTLAKLANGLCDNLLCAVYLSATCPVFIAPAMDEDMWVHPATKNNLETVRSFGNRIIPVGHGELASGLVGAGRLAEMEEILSALAAFFQATSSLELKGVKVLITAGPTFEKLDPVRFIGNYSTGKMGIALAEEIAEKGAEVKLILGPTSLRPNHPSISTVRIESASEMLLAAEREFAQCDIAIFAAAVADYRPAIIAGEKIKKTGDTLEIKLQKTADILKTLAARKTANQTVVGFALETENEVLNARKKLKEKAADMIVLNSLRDAGAGFGHDTNEVTIFRADGQEDKHPLQSKADTARNIVQAIIGYRNARKNP